MSDFILNSEVHVRAYGGDTTIEHRDGTPISDDEENALITTFDHPLECLIGPFVPALLARELARMATIALTRLDHVWECQAHPRGGANVPAECDCSVEALRKALVAIGVSWS